MPEKPQSANPQPSAPKQPTPTELELYKNACASKIENVLKNLVGRLQNEPNIINRYELQITIRTAQDIYNLLFNEGGK